MSNQFPQINRMEPVQYCGISKKGTEPKSKHSISLDDKNG